MTEITQKKRGRPSIPESERKNPKRNVKNVSLDADLVGSLSAIVDKLEPQIGFRPTLSQAVRYLINLSKKEM